MALFFILPLLLIQLLFLYSFVLNKNYSWKELNSENFKKPLVIWLEKQIELLKKEKEYQLILTRITDKKTA